MLYSLRRYEEALSACEQALQLDPNNAAFYADKGLALYRLERYEEALAACEQALQLNSTLALAYRHKGNVLERLGRSNPTGCATRLEKNSGKSTEIGLLAVQLHLPGIPIVFAMAHVLLLASSTTPASGS